MDIFKDFKMTAYWDERRDIMAFKISEEDARRFRDKNVWKKLTHRKRVNIAIRADKEIMPFRELKVSMGKALKRSIHDLELLPLNTQRLLDELEGKEGPPDNEYLIGLMFRQIMKNKKETK